MRRTPALAVLAAGLLAAGPARAETVSTRLTPDAPGDHLYAFTITVERLKEAEAGEYLQFHVTAKAKGDPGFRLPRRGGTLEVFAGKRFVSACDVQPTEQGGAVSFTFRVAARVAATSRFTFGETLNAEDPGGGFFYWFTLGDFVPPRAR